MDELQQIQEDEYAFPYHYLPHEEAGCFSEHRHLFWGYEYWSYLNEVTSYIQKKNPASVLDIGCGDGRLLNLLSERLLPGRRLVGVDYSEKALLFANAFRTSTDVQFMRGDIHTLTELTEAFDLITSIEVIEHIPPDTLGAFIHEHIRCLRVGGVLIITTPTENIPRTKKHYQHFTREKIAVLLPPGTCVIDTHYLNRRSYGSRVVASLLANRFWVTQSRLVRRTLYRIYQRYYAQATELTGSRILLAIEKRAP